MKDKIIIFIPAPFVVRNFMETNSFESLEKEYDVCYLVGEKFYKKTQQAFSGKNVITHNFNSKNYFLRDFLKTLFNFRASKFSSTYAYGFYNEDGTWAKKTFLFKILGSRFLYKPLLKLVELFIPIDKSLAEKIKNVSPKFIIMSMASPGNAEMDISKIAKQLRIKFGIVPPGWDNISSKLHQYIYPDFVIERGDQNVELAKKLFELDEKHVSKVGVPHYEMYFSYQHEYDLENKRKEYLDKIGIPADKKVLLFGGALRPFDETSLLEMLDNAITNGVLENVHIIYRPHPSRNKRIKEKSYFDYDFKHITFDEELKETYINIVEEKNNVVNKLPDLINYMDLYNSIDAIISPFSSVMVEAALFGKPVLGLACDDGIHFGYSSTKEIATREHFKVLKKFDWFIQCDEKEKLIDDCKNLLQITKSPNIQERVKQDIEQIVYHDDKEFSQRLLEAINSQK